MGECISKKCKEGIVVQKWKDKQDVLMLGTKYGDEMIQIQRSQQEIVKPKTIIEYNT